MPQALPPDFAAALDRSQPAKERFAALPGDAQHAWVRWATRPRRRAQRAARIEEAVRRLGAPAAVARAEEVPAAVPPPPEREWWPWLLLLLVLVVAGLLAWYFITRHHG